MLILYFHVHVGMNDAKLLECVATKKIGGIKEALHNGANIDYIDGRGDFALQLAARDDKYFAVAKLLIERGANVNLVNQSGISALMEASKNGCIKLVRLLLFNGALTNLEDWQQKTALMHLCSNKAIPKAKFLEVAQQIIKHGANLNHQTSTGKSALMVACTEDNLLAVNFLLYRITKVNLLDNTGQSALMMACKQGLKEIAELLIEYGAHTDVQDKGGKTALITAYEASTWNRASGWNVECGKLLVSSSGLSSVNEVLIRACREGRKEWVELLLPYTPDIDYDKNALLVKACMSRNLDIVALLLDNGAHVNTQDNQGKTALMRACEIGGSSIVELLLRNKAQVDVRDKEGKTALMKAYEIGDGKTVQLLLNSGAQVDVQDKEGKTALMKACQMGNERTVVILLNRGAQVDIQDCEGKTALMLIDVLDDHKIKKVKKLVKSHANVNLQDNEGRTALMKFCEMYRDYKLVQLLMKSNTDVNLQDNKGRTALMIACEAKSFETIQLLLDLSADVNLQDRKGKTALMIICEKLHAEDPQLLELRFRARDLEGEDRRFQFENVRVSSIVKLLLDNGAQVHLQDSEGVTALMIACQKGVELCVECLATMLTEDYVNLQDNEGKTALMKACTVGIKDIIQILLDEAAHIDLQDNAGQTALMFACKFGWTDVVALLIKRGARINIQDNSGESASTIAAKLGLIDLSLGLEHGAKTDEQISLSQISTAEYEVDELLRKIRSPAHPQYSSEIVQVDSMIGDPPLVVASELGDKDGTELLLNDGADIESKDSKGRTALITASGNGHTTVTDLLLERGANIDSQDDEGYSALMTACKNGQVQTTSCLLDQYADTSLKNSDGKTAFDLAMESSNVELLPLFTKLRKKPSYPGILFLEGAKRETVAIKEKIINLQEVGISLSIPENALPPTDPPLQLEIQPCFNGSFDLPQDVKLASPAYIIKPSRKVAFQKEVSVKIWHHANLESEEDCKDMVFLSASTSPQYRGDTPVYVFKKIRGAKGSFRPGEEQPVGQIVLKHFCILALGKRKREDGEESREAEQKCSKGL